MIVGSALWTLIRQSDLATWSILISLLIISIICWTIAIHKWFTIRQQEEEAHITAALVNRCRNLDELQAVSLQRAASAGGILVVRAQTQARLLHAQSSRALTYDEITLIRDDIDAALQDALNSAEEHTIALKVAAEVSPLLGLLGTIWGLIHSFVRISNERSADITTVAPGIAEALITTLMGLLVAIPALVFFHIVQRKIQSYELCLVTIAEQCERVIRHCGPGGGIA